MLSPVDTTRVRNSVQLGTSSHKLGFPSTRYQVTPKTRDQYFALSKAESTYHKYFLITSIVKPSSHVYYNSVFSAIRRYPEQPYALCFRKAISCLYAVWLQCLWQLVTYQWYGGVPHFTYVMCQNRHISRETVVTRFGSIRPNLQLGSTRLGFSNRVEAKFDRTEEYSEPYLKMRASFSIVISQRQQINLLLVYS
eukprot:TRINITY_DN5773_c0_g1_i3.p1 TRINITY_DN5773_c0_g1~~TRINITY_DN5773_c0_g1_i3.p1  ORF type:complete len:195 (+),score=-3.29 TRINITY_DN5773_c0_g1_i3:494-1078(+)